MLKGWAINDFLMSLIKLLKYDNFVKYNGFFYHKENHYNFLFFFGAESNSKSS